MLQKRLNYFKHYYIDTADPEGSIAKLAFRTAFACALSIVLFQFFGNDLLSIWAGFATFAIVQNDTQELFGKRLRFLIGVSITIALLVFAGMLIGNHAFLFILTIPPIIFACGYVACLGFSYFNAGAWSAFLYIFAGASPANLNQAALIGGVILICGLISVLVCFLVLPVRPLRIILQSYERILAKLLVLLDQYKNNNPQRTIKFNTQLDQMLSLQERNLAVYLEAAKLSAAKQAALINLSKLLYQVSLMVKSTLAFQPQVAKHSSYALTQLDSCNEIIEKVIEGLLNQFKYKKSPDFKLIRNKLEIYRENVTAIRKSELTQAEPDFIALADYANYFYHFIKLTELLEMASNNIAQLEGDL